MKTLTLSRYICEMTLQEYNYVQEKASKLAAASLLLALYMKKLGYWVNACKIGVWGQRFKKHKVSSGEGVN